jgi:hypothetical protein
MMQNISAFDIITRHLYHRPGYHYHAYYMLLRLEMKNKKKPLSALMLCFIPFLDSGLAFLLVFRF